MSQTQTQLFPPPNQSQAVDDKGYLTKTQQLWQFTLQNQLPLVVIDTSGGSIVATPPPAGLNSTTGQSNQNMEITYKKSSADGNSFTLNGVVDGPQVISAQYAHFRIKSDGSSWWLIG